jgi:hypothetical protein
MSRLVFIFEEGGSASTDVMLPKGEPDNHELAVKNALADLLPRVATHWGPHNIKRVVYKRYDPEFKTAFRDYPVPVDVGLLNERLHALRDKALKEGHAYIPRPRKTVPDDEPTDAEPDDPGGST